MNGKEEKSNTPLSLRSKDNDDDIDDDIDVDVDVHVDDGEWCLWRGIVSRTVTTNNESGINCNNNNANDPYNVRRMLNYTI